jgi:hypothetical protein
MDKKEREIQLALGSLNTYKVAVSRVSRRVNIMITIKEENEKAAIERAKQLMDNDTVGIKDDAGDLISHNEEEWETDYEGDWGEYEYFARKEE